MSEEHLTIQDLARRERVPVATIYQWNSRGEGPRYMRIGRHVRYRLRDVEAWENRRAVEPLAGLRGGGDAPAA